jgi:hypothetical protein
MSKRIEAAKRVAHYRRLLSLREQNPGESVAVFCRRHGMSVWTYYYWRKRLGGGLEVGAVRPTFVQVADGEGVRAVVPTLGVELAFPGGLQARLPRGYSREELLMVVAAGRGAGCLD